MYRCRVGLRLGSLLLSEIIWAILHPTNIETAKLCCVRLAENLAALCANVLGRRDWVVAHGAAEAAKSACQSDKIKPELAHLLWYFLPSASSISIK